ncbi:hypothetical protein AVEN_39040-1 [Araneus ventricosus]|uniref:Uncharacterized protein n=1 Tax=Araneus ventricosus TaxID=182803 RepID=A0A4Y2MCW2_ARAVE|nr:hypothetical protein AVEN_39040-1 [Araneus ventricosus]
MDGEKGDQDFWVRHQKGTLSPCEHYPDSPTSKQESFEGETFNFDGCSSGRSPRFEIFGTNQMAGYRLIDTPGTEMYHPSNESPRTANTWGILLSMRSRKQIEWQQLLMESSLAYPRGKEGKGKN